MKLGNLKTLFIIIFFIKFSVVFAQDSIESVPLINLEDLSPTFEEDKSELENEKNKSINVKKDKVIVKESENLTDDKVYINLKALDKITAKTSSFRLAVGSKKLFGPLEIKALKCKISESEGISDTVAYIQVKDFTSKDNDSVFLFNGWTFSSSPTLKSIDHPVYDLWITGCENI